MPACCNEFHLTVLLLFRLCRYGFFKIASTSSIAPTSARPGMFSVEGRAKWDAWEAAGKSLPADCSDVVEAAKLRYTNIVRVAMGAESL